MDYQRTEPKGWYGEINDSGSFSGMFIFES